MWDRVCDSVQCRLDIFLIENGSFLQKLSVFDKIIVNLALRGRVKEKENVYKNYDVELWEYEVRNNSYGIF